MISFSRRKIIFIIFKNNYRKNALGNFGKSEIYNNFIIINLSGRIKSFLGKFLYFFNLGKFISIDGDPFLKNKSNSINIWYPGTSLKIHKKFKSFENNYVNITNPVLIPNEKYFNIYPIIKTKNFYSNDRKIIFMGKFHFEPKDEIYFNTKKLNSIKKKILNNFSLIDTKNFWQKYMPNASLEEKFENYKIIKTFLRKEILKKINLNFKEKFRIYGLSTGESDFNFLKPTYNLRDIRKIYQGNICIDTGPIPGSVTFSPRAIQIFESGGIILQTNQSDAKQKLNNLYEELTANNIDNYLKKIEELIISDEKCKELIEKIKQFSFVSKNKLNSTLMGIFDENRKS
jgi:hypothetical protein